jgi:hypothetical protein
VVAVVAAAKDGTRVRYEAKKGVVLATGGFAANKELRMKYDSRITPTSAPRTTPAPPETASSCGEGRRGLVGMEYIQLLPLGDPKTGALDGWVGFNVEDYIYINKKGQRFVSEAERRDVMTQALIKQPDQFMYIVCDAHSMPRPRPRTASTRPPSSWSRPARAFSADTIEELAVKIGVDPVAFRKSVDEYNLGWRPRTIPSARSSWARRSTRLPSTPAPGYRPSTTPWAA